MIKINTSDKARFILGDQHDNKHESLNIEFKEFCLNMTSDTVRELFDVDNISRNGIINDQKLFNNTVLKSIKHYIYKYIPLINT